MRIQLHGTGAFIIGAVVAAAVGIGVGVWLRPHIAESPAPDAYASDTITAPTPDRGPPAEPIAADWSAFASTPTDASSASIWPTAAAAPATDADLPGGADTTQADSDAGAPAQPDVDAILPPPDHGAADTAPAAVQQAADLRPASAKQPGDWDLPASAYARDSSG